MHRALHDLGQNAEHHQKWSEFHAKASAHHEQLAEGSTPADVRHSGTPFVNRSAANR